MEKFDTRAGYISPTISKKMVLFAVKHNSVNRRNRTDINVQVRNYDGRYFPHSRNPEMDRHLSQNSSFLKSCLAENSGPKQDSKETTDKCESNFAFVYSVECHM